MKRINYIYLLSFIVVNQAFGNDNFYYAFEEKIYYENNFERALIVFTPGLSFEEKSRVVSNYPVFLDLNGSSRIDENSYWLKTNSTENEDIIHSSIEKLNKELKVRSAELSYTNTIDTDQTFDMDYSFFSFSDVFYVKPKNENDKSFLRTEAEKLGCTFLENYTLDNSILYFSSRNSSLGNSNQTSKFFHESKMYEFSGPEIYSHSTGSCVSEPHFSSQWNLSNSNNPGTDINVCSAWNISTGENIVIAILDNGVQLDHSDLDQNLVSGYDAWDPTSGNNGDQTNADAHGTSCAGIAAGELNGSGIVGVAYNSKIMPIKIADGSSSGWDTNSTKIKNGINWAVNNGADILSMSIRTTYSMDIENALEDATIEGRNFLGSIVFAASGNREINSVEYPANSPHTIAVGASNTCGFRKTAKPNQHCENPKWGSSFGAEMDLVAPGVNIPTTTINNNYIMDWNGTSASCPMAAGVMALALSVNRCLTYQKAREIISMSCEKIGGYCYITGKPYGFWDDEVGYGLINAHKAVQYALNPSTTAITGSGSGTNLVPTAVGRWSLSSSCTSRPPGVYFVDRYELEATINYPYTPFPTIIGSVNGCSAANPNDGRYYYSVSNLTETSATIKTFVYYLKQNSVGQQINQYYPTSPSNVVFDLRVVSSVSPELYLQNQSITFGTNKYYATDFVRSGKQVTSSIPSGNFIVSNAADVTVKASNYISLEDGTDLMLAQGGSFLASLEPFFTCSQYPNGRIIGQDGFDPIVIEDYNVEFNSPGFDEALIAPLKISPNPVSSVARIEYEIEDSEAVTITIHDGCGRPALILKNKEDHAKGKYNIRFDGVNLAPGVYTCHLRTNSKSEVINFVVH